MRALLIALLLAACAPSTAPGPESPDEPRTGRDQAKKSRDDAGDIPEREPGPRTAAVSNRVVRLHRTKFRACYDRARSSAPDLAGKVEISFFIQPDGTVKSAEVDASKSELKNDELSDCLIKTVKAIKFPAAGEEVGSKMHYPFDFQPGGAP